MASLKLCLVKRSYCVIESSCGLTKFPEKVARGRLTALAKSVNGDNNSQRTDRKMRSF